MPEEHVLIIPQLDINLFKLFIMEIKSGKIQQNRSNISNTRRYMPIPVADPEGFTWGDFIYNEAAVRKGLSNMPDLQAREAIRQLVVNLLDPLRSLYGKPLRIISGYRSPIVNLLVKGVPGSQHTKGEAADVCAPEGPEYLFNLLEAAGLDFDQAIVYQKRFFLHLSYKADGGNRREVLFR